MLKKTLSKEPEGLELVIRADRRVKMGRIQEVIRLVQQSGVESYSLVVVREENGE
jgi:biopolymer transport protein ExbD